jgi:hypothetical protein
VAAHEVIHDVVKKESGFIFKLDYEKGYDRVDREFIITMVMNSREHTLSIFFIYFLLFLSTAFTNFCVRVLPVSFHML